MEIKGECKFSVNISLEVEIKGKFKKLPSSVVVEQPHQMRSLVPKVKYP